MWYIYSQNFLLPFIDELWKTQKIRLLKKWKKIAIIILHMCNKDHMRHSSWDTEWDRMFCHFGLFYPPKKNPTTQKTKLLKKMKTTSGDVIILNLCNKKTWSYDVCLLICSATDIYNCHFRPFFALLPHYWLKIKIWKKCNKKPGYNILLPLRTINQDHMRYEVQQTECFCHLGTFFYAILFLRYGLSRM